MFDSYLESGSHKKVIAFLFKIIREGVLLLSSNAIKQDNSYAGWTEYDVKEKCWQIFTLSGETYVKKDFRGNFIHTGTGKVLTLNQLFPQIRNCTDAAGFIIARRKRYGSPLWQQKKNRKLRLPTI